MHTVALTSMVCEKMRALRQECTLKGQSLVTNVQLVRSFRHLHAQGMRIGHDLVKLPHHDRVNTRDRHERKRPSRKSVMLLWRLNSWRVIERLRLVLWLVASGGIIATLTHIMLRFDSDGAWVVAV